ncbi:MAG TPA: NAD(P)-binding domain-containing protein [Actinoplanes sp.]
MTLDYLIIGAGPAGVQLAALLEAEGKRDYLVLERGDAPGTFFTRYPRHRTLISLNKVYTGSDDPELNLRMDWNSLLSDDPSLLFKNYSVRYFPPAEALLDYLADFAAKTGVRIRFGTNVDKVAKEGDEFVVQAGEETWRAKRLVVATGVTRTYRPDIPGLELAEGYDTMSVDPQDFTNQRVLVLGKANSAFETADNLIETTSVLHVAGPSSIRLAWRTHFVGHLRAVNNNFLDTYELKAGNAVLDGTVRSIERDGDHLKVLFAFSRADEVVKELHYDRVLLCTGFAFDASIFDESCRPELTVQDRFPAQTSAWESVNVPGMYFAGTITQVRDFKKSTSGFIHGFRYGARALHKILGQRHDDTPWPSKETPDIAGAIIERVNRTSALWQQFGFLADVVTVRDGTRTYHEEVPLDFFAEGGLGGYDDAFAITLEYGPEHDQVDPFDITVKRVAQDSVGQAHDAAYLHPVIRHFQGGTVRATHHLAENLENRWNRGDVHVAPLVDFVDRVLAGA